MLTIKRTALPKWLLCLSAILSIFITYTYASSRTILYGGMEIALAIFCYLIFFYGVSKSDKFISLVFGVLTIISFLNGIVRGDIKSVILLSLSIVVPIAISVLDIDFSKNGKEFYYGFIIGFIVIIVQFATGILGSINSNTFGFYCYMAISVGFVWFKISEKKRMPLILILITSFLSVGAGSRNVAIVLLLTLILLFLPNRAYGNKFFFRVIYIVTILYTIFASSIMEWIFSHEKLASLLIKYTESVSDKAWTMESRIEFLQEVKFKIQRLDIFTKIFGEGILDHHGHNMFYQSIFVYGYLGTILLYLIYIRIFERAYTLIKEDNDKIALGCFLGLIGMFLLNGGDLFLVGTETCAIIPQVFMGIILLRYRKYKQRKMIKPVNKEKYEGD